MPIAPTMWNIPRNTLSGGQHEMPLDTTWVVSESRAFGGPSKVRGSLPHIYAKTFTALFMSHSLPFPSSLSAAFPRRVPLLRRKTCSSPLRTTYQRTLHDISQPSTPHISFRNVTFTDTSPTLSAFPMFIFLPPGYVLCINNKLDV